MLCVVVVVVGVFLLCFCCGMFLRVVFCLIWRFCLCGKFSVCVFFVWDVFYVGICFYVGFVFCVGSFLSVYCGWFRLCVVLRMIDFADVVFYDDIG